MKKKIEIENLKRKDKKKAEQSKENGNVLLCFLLNLCVVQ